MFPARNERRRGQNMTTKFVQKSRVPVYFQWHPSVKIPLHYNRGSDVSLLHILWGIWLYIFVSVYYDASMSSNDTSNEMAGFQGLSDVLCDIRDSDQIQRFLEEILTPAERRDLSLRWQLMKMLKQGIPQRKIAKELHISLCKITRGAKILKQDHSISKDYLIAGEQDESQNPTG